MDGAGGLEGHHQQPQRAWAPSGEFRSGGGPFLARTDGEGGEGGLNAVVDEFGSFPSPTPLSLSLSLEGLSTSTSSSSISTFNSSPESLAGAYDPFFRAGGGWGGGGGEGWEEERGGGGFSKGRDRELEELNRKVVQVRSFLTLQDVHLAPFHPFREGRGEQVLTNTCRLVDETRARADGIPPIDPIEPDPRPAD